MTLLTALSTVCIGTGKGESGSKASSGEERCGAGGVRAERATGLVAALLIRDSADTPTELM